MRRITLAALLSLPGCQTVALPERMVALGTEPFWSVEVMPASLVYSTPENQPGTIIAAQLTGDGIWSGRYNGQQFVLRIAVGKCSDGMSDTVYAWSATLTVAGRTERGCAKLR
jgi:uncharacterized membrane protein